jgi:hypothetical protein
MSAVDLETPILEDRAIRSINFFNGRLLTARDLTREQTANRNVDKRLGQAIGDGIAYGFEVSRSSSSTNDTPVITVKAGLAINHLGQTLQLNDNIDISLVPQPDTVSNVSQPFNECVPLQTGTYTAGAGVYLLTLAPARAAEGLAPVAGLDLGIASCNTDTIVSALQFRLIKLNPPLTDVELADENHLRNLVAYKCFGVTEVQSFVTNPFGTELMQYGLLDSLRTNRLTNCDVPLAVLYWTLSDGIKFIDLWSVRRRLIDPATTDPSRIVTGERRLAEAEAMLLQFEDQIHSLQLSGIATNSIMATSYFKYLPPAGLIPIHTARSPTGFRYENFFRNVVYREPVFIEGAKVEPLFRNALTCKPIDLISGEMIWLYRVRENMRSIDRSSPGTTLPYMIFCSGYVPFIGDARFDLSRWNYSNYFSSLL